MILFINADPEFQSWRSQHKDTGFVVGCKHWPQADKKMVLHRAGCKNTPNWAATTYSKACSTERAELENWAKNDVKGKLDNCGSCHPEA